MDYKEYDDYLSSVHGSKKWAALPRVDTMVFDHFDTTRPSIAGRPHRLVEAGAEMFGELLAMLDDKAAILNRPYIPSFAAEGRLGYSPHDEVYAWITDNQKWLTAKLVESLKYEQGGKHFLFSSRVSDETITRLAHIRYDLSLKDWFDRLNEALDDARWIYVPFSEETSLDLIVVRSDLSGKLQKVDDLFSQKHWQFGSLKLFGDRYQWPADLVN